MVHGIVKSPIIDVQTYNNKNITGIQYGVSCPVQKKMCTLISKKRDKSIPFLIIYVARPENVIQIAIPIEETINKARRLNLLRSQALDTDITRRVTPNRILHLYASISVPIS